MSPSPSTSAAKTDRAPSAVVEMIRSVKTWLPLFSYQAILSSNGDAESTSVSPSPSTSAAKTDCAPSAVVEMIRCGEDLAAVVLVPGNRVVIDTTRRARRCPHPRPRPPQRPNGLHRPWWRSCSGFRRLRGHCGRADRDGVVFHLAVERHSAHPQVPCRAQPKPGDRRPVRRRAGYVEGQHVAAVDDQHVVGNLLQRPAPAAVAIEVEPGVQPRAAGRVGNGDRDRGAQLPTWTGPNETPSSSSGTPALSSPSASSECRPSGSVSRTLPSIGPTSSCRGPSSDRSVG